MVLLPTDDVPWGKKVEAAIPTEAYVILYYLITTDVCTIIWHAYQPELFPTWRRNNDRILTLHCIMEVIAALLQMSTKE
jgi:hypothetical protein